MSDFISILIYSIWQQGATQEWFESDETNRNEISQRIPNERTPLRNNHHTCTKSQRFSRVSRRGEASNININIKKTALAQSTYFQGNAFDISRSIFVYEHDSCRIEARARLRVSASWNEKGKKKTKMYCQYHNVNIFLPSSFQIQLPLPPLSLSQPAPTPPLYGPLPFSSSRFLTQIFHEIREEYA